MILLPIVVTPCLLSTLSMAMSSPTKRTPSPSTGLRGILSKRVDCRQLCLITGIQGSVGSCRCGYLLFTKRSHDQDSKSGDHYHSGIQQLRQQYHSQYQNHPQQYQQDLPLYHAGLEDFHSQYVPEDRNLSNYFQHQTQKLGLRRLTKSQSDPPNPILAKMSTSEIVEMLKTINQFITTDKTEMTNMDPKNFKLLMWLMKNFDLQL